MQDLRSIADSLSSSQPSDLPPLGVYGLIRQRVCLLGFPLAMAVSFHFLLHSDLFQDLQQGFPLR